MPVGRKHHHAQLPNTPCPRTRSVTRFGVSVEKVVATMEVPSSHHGRLRPPRKNDSRFFPDFNPTRIPSSIVVIKTAPMIPQSKAVISSMIDSP